MSTDLLRCLPGRVSIHTGTRVDYDALACFHYLPLAPRTWAGVWVVRYQPDDATVPTRAVAVGVLSWPTAVSGGRDAAFGLRGLRYGAKIRFANAHLRTISRVIVHPQFRSLGLASALVRHICNHCPTRYVEAAARMGLAHPLFEAAGMRRVAGTLPDKPLYYLFDRHPHLEEPRHDQAHAADASVDRSAQPHDQAHRAGAGRTTGDARGAATVDRHARRAQGDAPPARGAGDAARDRPGARRRRWGAAPAGGDRPDRPEDDRPAAHDRGGAGEPGPHAIAPQPRVDGRDATGR